MYRKEPKNLNFKFLLPLSFLFLTIYLTSTAVAFKMIDFFHFIEPAPPFIFPITYALLDLIADVYGYKVTKQLIWWTLVFQFIYAIIITLFIHLPSPSEWKFQSAYDVVYGNTLRFIFAGTLATLSGSFINSLVFSRLKIKFQGKHFWLRSIISSSIGGAVLVGLIVLLGYKKSDHSAINFFIVIYSLELIYSFILSFPTSLLSAYIKLKENLDVYDYNVNYNPFRFE